jgi:hypothetical protein
MSKQQAPAPTPDNDQDQLPTEPASPHDDPITDPIPPPWTTQAGAPVADHGTRLVLDHLRESLPDGYGIHYIDHPHYYRVVIQRDGRDPAHVSIADTGLVLRRPGHPVTQITYEEAGDEGLDRTIHDLVRLLREEP